MNTATIRNEMDRIYKQVGALQFQLGMDHLKDTFNQPDIDFLARCLVSRLTNRIQEGLSYDDVRDYIDVLEGE